MEYILYFIITIGVLVFVHEFGHFASAKLSKMRVDVFALGFGKRLFGWNKLTGFTFGDLPKDFDGQGHTDYRLSLLPLGGYVKIAGMVDESFDTKFTEREPQPWEFRAKKTIPKLFVITAGVLMNLLLTLVIFWGINFYQGKLIYKTTAISNVEQGSAAEQAGFQSNDRIISIDGVEVQDWDQVVESILVTHSTSDLPVKVERNGTVEDILIPRKLLNENSSKGFIFNPSPSHILIDKVIKNSPAQDAGFKDGDFILAINNTSINEASQITGIVSSNKDKVMSAVLLRDKDTIRTNVKATMDGKIGISFSRFGYTGKIEYRTYGFFSSISNAFLNAGHFTYLTFSMLKDVLTGKRAFNQTFGGPLKIAQFAAKSADIGIIAFLYFLALLSLSLAIINILPFPVLDGGHFIIILLEGIFKKELPIKIKIAIQNAGFVILLLLMAFIIYNDFISL
jgi:regulator of sigma E protease